jgi:hypothetical protein
MNYPTYGTLMGWSLHNSIANIRTGNILVEANSLGNSLRASLSDAQVVKLTYTVCKEYEEVVGA